MLLSQHLEPRYAARLLADQPGGLGYLLKERVRDVAEFIEAVERVAHGGTAFDPEVVKSLVDGHRRSALDDLTEREVQILRLIALGHTNAEISGQLFLSVRTVESHRSHIQQKLRRTNRADLVRYAIDHGFLDEPTAS